MPIDDFFIPAQEPTESSSLVPFESSASKKSTSRKRKGLPREQTMEQIFENLRNFVDTIHPEFKALTEAASRNVESVARTVESNVRNVKIATRNEAPRIQIEEKKKLLGQVLFKIDGIIDDEAIFMLLVLAKDEDQLKVFWDLPNDKKLCFYRVFLTRISHHPLSK